MEVYPFTSREQVFDHLDDYARQRKEEIDRRELGRERGLIKSYLLEARQTSDDLLTAVRSMLRGIDWHVAPLNGEPFFLVRDASGPLGFLEPLSARHWILHSTEATQRADKAVNDAVLNSAQLDFAWLAGSYFQAVWEDLILLQMPQRFVAMKFEHQARFESDGWEGRDVESDEDPGDAEQVEQRASVLAIAERSERVGYFLPRLQEIHPPFKAIKMLRIPAAGLRGGYDFWSHGKVTYRAPDFRQGRDQALSLMRLYEQVTAAIEHRLWFDAERTTLSDGSASFTFTGAPVTLVFDPPLSSATFQNLVATTFEKGQGPLRLMGNPIYLGKRKAHIYGVDLHLWQRIYLEITPARLTAVLPRGTCGNTVHRLVANIQRYVAPTVKAHIGDIGYDDLIQNIFLGRARS
jgi:hypothetical protein